MVEDPPPNIFDFAGKKKSPKKKIHPASHHTPAPLQEKKPSEDKEITQMLDRMNFMRRDLEKKLEEVYSKSGMSPYEIDAFLNNPKNVGNPLWEKMQEQRKQVADRLRSMAGIEQKTRNEIEKHKEIEIEIKKRKSKLLGTRKKWIPIK
ncbi:putative uncharacterized protein [Parachlamydia acanthamoebae UV-7]|uniref:Uncharacterized protein n=1 Tax=Parachlamydia acanthamoebae (strain UV7) TaxID=765952 RepID=F8KWC7_PARAV|nr:hypothetical protein [Parachlamydia acanthamoebae]CCB85325.1 putative uncharacterized protein [Parachlamydia acanthamoebae UV-7]